MIRFVFRWAFRLLLLAILLVIGLLLLKDHLAGAFAEQRIRQETGFETKIGKLRVGLLSPKITAENVVLYNPPELGGARLIDAPEVHLEYDPKELFLRRVHLTFLRLRISEINIVQSTNRPNVLELAQDSTVRSSPSSNKANEYTFSGVDLLNLSIAKVRYRHLQRPKRNQDVQLGLENHLLRNVRSPHEFTSELLKLLFRAGITIYAD